LVNEILPTGQVLHLESTEVHTRPDQIGQTTAGVFAENRRSAKSPDQLSQMGQTNAGAAPATHSSLGRATGSPGLPDDLKRKRADAIAAWAGLPAQLAREDAEHRKKKLEEYAAYKEREGLSDPQLDPPTYGNKGASPPKTDAQVTRSPISQEGIIDCESKENVTPNINKDLVRPSDLREELLERKNREVITPTTDQAVVKPSVASPEKDGKSGFQVCLSASQHYVV
jgi:hypothetical protein